MRDIKKTIVSLMKRHGTNDPFRIAIERNIILRFEDLKATYGYFLHSNRMKFIHINNKLDESFQRFVCAHELGHAILHPRVSTPFLRAHTLFSVDKIEIEANTFAVELLLPDEIISQYKNTDMTIYDVAKLHSVPKELVHLKKI
ncbi:ImmA/IrrE family metallo-endopeptidase [Thermaerobacillus caldiproteolyticus]|uniref:ImmA/IrrE family metallo-endopeptidase n=1 Tax=Thermaerobacillus caldiproteolyticus TaxID=247480 RepID=UPI0018F10D28|nr:ImmA/IrrE family metallo-endopeptidase [Anoxybacillus caldiproteolyticus]